MSLSGAGTLETSHCGDGTNANRHPWHPPAALTGDPIAEGKLLMRNTLTGRKEAFVPASKRAVRWYTCGPTVYDSAHVGHARTYLSFDIMRRVMTDYFHYNVLYQINTTDIDDKIILRARQNVLVKNLEDDASVDFEALSALADKALAEARAKAAEKKDKIQKELDEAVARSDSRSVTEQKDLLSQAALKERNLENDAAAIAERRPTRPRRRTGPGSLRPPRAFWPTCSIGRRATPSRTTRSSMPTLGITRGSSWRIWTPSASARPTS